ncbi:toxin-antitoxin system antitoxin subunit [Nocardioides currus]|uniref:Toxin-antitoxin system antitoxin subunit n=1 Tax=Nocardioides currus TaxID=2133958 RepID=A0A2R7Z1E8_9ACTN|nr:toxin-antitoxin system antitoxin subunit [Nocardioides currus]PUA82445.1 toxin-antitoxin system antitoxin subunit [Nocardioides currus]
MTTRITVSLPEELVAAAHAAVAAGSATSVSAYVASALSEKAGRETLAGLLAEWVEELGPPTADEEAWVEGALAEMGLGD